MALFIFVMILILNLLQTSESETVPKSQLFKKAKAKANTGSQQLVSWESESERCKNLGVSLSRSVLEDRHKTKLINNKPAQRAMQLFWPHMQRQPARNV